MQPLSSTFFSNRYAHCKRISFNLLTNIFNVKVGQAIHSIDPPPSKAVARRPEAVVRRFEAIARRPEAVARRPEAVARRSGGRTLP